MISLSWPVDTSVTNLGSIEQTLSLLSICSTLANRPHAAHTALACACLRVSALALRCFCNGTHRGSLAVVKMHDVRPSRVKVRPLTEVITEEVVAGRGLPSNKPTNNSTLCLLINSLWFWHRLSLRKEPFSSPVNC